MTGLGNPIVSIIMPAYNVECYISEAIESILAQTYTTFELLICDDGSTDATLAVAKKIIPKKIQESRFLKTKKIRES